MPFTSGMFPIHVHIIIDVNDVVAAREIVKEAYDPQGYDETYSRELSETGNDPATYFAAGCQVAEIQVNPFIKATLDALPRCWMLVYPNPDESTEEIALARRRKVIKKGTGYQNRMKFVRKQIEQDNYNDPNWKTRSEGYILQLNQSQSFEQFLTFIETVSVPTLSLKTIDPET